MSKKDEALQEAEEKAESKVGTNALSVYRVDAKNGVETYERTYSVEVHGEDFKKLAEMRASKIGGKVYKAKPNEKA